MDPQVLAPAEIASSDLIQIVAIVLLGKSAMHAIARLSVAVR
jgi:hypothetical protein